MKKLYKPDKLYKLYKLKNSLTSILFYISILVFIISFNFSDAPTPSGWYQQWMPNLGGKTIQDIIFLDSLTGYASARQTSDTSYILKTTNGGDNWQIIFRNFYAMTQIQFLNTNTGYAVGAYLYKTTNGGFSWVQVNAPPISPEDLYVISEDTIWIISSESLTGGVFRTTNGGVNWTQQINLGSSNPDHIYMFNGSIGFICETNNYIRKTTNSGLNWDTILNGESFTDMYFADSLTGWKADNGTMKKTIDGGLVWVNQQFPVTYATGIIKFSNVNKDTIWGAGGIIAFPNNQFRGIVYKTTNSGSNWGYQIPDTTINIFEYFHNKFANKLNGWAYATSSGIHTVTGGDTITYYTPVKPISNKIPKQYKLYQNYPNPFNTSSKLKIENSKLAKIQVVVYDVTGKLVTTLLNQPLSPGTYEVEFDGTNYTSGVYFYSMYADGKLIETKRMILLK